MGAEKIVYADSSLWRLVPGMGIKVKQGDGEGEEKCSLVREYYGDIVLFYIQE